MDSNASQSPGPDLSRRRSGRVVKLPEKFGPDATHTAAKRKRGIDPDGDDVENNAPPDSDEEMSEGASEEEAEPSDDQESDDDAGARRRRAAAKKKAARPSRPRKPANKRVKTNGASADPGGHPSSLPSRPKKSARIERLPEDGTGLFADIFGSGDSSDSVAEQWLTRYRADDGAAVTELVNCVLQCSGCELEVTEDDIRDPDNCQNRLADIQGVWQDQQITDYPLIAKTRGAKSFRDLLTGFFKSVVHLIHTTDILYNDEALMENIHRWVATLSSSTLRPFRHTATAVSLAIQAGLVEVGAILDNRITSVEQQLQASKRAKNKSKTQEMQRALDEANSYRETCGNHIRDFFDTVFVHRYRDIDPRIRTECVEALGYWIWELPTVFMEPEYLRYLGWMLTDAVHSTRQEVLRQLSRMFKRDASQLGHFIDRFRPRLIEIATMDADVSVRVAAISVIETLRENGMLEPDEVDGIGRLIFDSDLRVRKAIVSFFTACVQDLIDAKTDEIGGSEAVEEVLGSVEDDDYETPRQEWISIKCLAENLAAYDAQIEESNPQEAPAALDVSAGLLQGPVPDTRISLAAQVLYEKMPEVKQWEAIAGYLLYDHTTSSKPKSSRGKGNPEHIIKAALAPTEDEEAILLEVTAAAAKLNLSPSHPEQGKKKGHRGADLAEDAEETAVQLASTIPRLLNKFGADPDTATLVLRLEHVLDLEAFPVLRQDSSKYEKLLDEISTQFNRHDDRRVLSEVTKALLHARQYDELEELADVRLAALWDNAVESLRNFDKFCELSSRGNLEADRLAELGTALLKISKLASISDCIDVLEMDGRSADSSASIISILIEIVHRGKLDQSDPEIDDAEDQVVEYAVESCQFYFMWKIRSIISLISRGAAVPTKDIEGLSYLKEKYSRNLMAAFTSRTAVDDLCRSATGTYCDFHVLLAQLRPHVERVSTEAWKGQNLDRVAGLISEIGNEATRELTSIFEGVEKHFATSTQRTLNEPAEDEDPIDLEDDDEEDPNEGLSAAEKLSAQLTAEKQLCELTGKLVLAISSRALDSSGRLRRRLLRNSTRLGNNYKEIVSYLDEKKVAQLLAGGKKGKRAAAPPPKAVSRPEPKSAERVVDHDDDDDDDDVVLTDLEDHGEQENESEEDDEEEAPPANDDDDVLGD
ncbi:related to nuclear protein SA-1 [Cephalotrichum gorgonifer]|uniref:Related to nuclear protein SA-1 n=1 Tax=Cephalotrichum gorgonifer TaxID=2041049 RepID=A0AAE8MU75_9PEZI|nr:related to nuclear protein SA-1 [Cephalotrichum gorgonifer]